LLAANHSGSVLSIFLEHVTEAATLEGCTEGLRHRIDPGGPFQLADVKQSQQGSMAVLEYVIHEAQGAPVEQKNVFGCLFKEDVYVDIHLSKAPSKDADVPLLMTILRSAAFVDVGASEHANSLPASSAAFFADGNAYFKRQDFDKAIGPYQEALDLEKREQKLPSVQWRVLVDNLAMAYGITGKLTASDDVLEYGLTKDPTYPMFYFIRADVYAERNDLDNTLKYLRLALKYKNNMIPGEKLPDPRTDDSFARFRENDEFKKLAAEFE
jgi:tetratricopeptide (TPR) repeat protein